MDSKKGKERVPIQEDEGNSEPGDSSSMISRIAASASGLTSSAFAAPGSNDLNDTSRAALSNSEKGSSRGGGSGSSAWAESSKQPRPQFNSQAEAAGLRVGHTEGHVRAAEQEFSAFLDGIDSFTPSDDASSNAISFDTGADQAFEYAWAKSRAGKPLPNQTQSASILEQERRDGEAILAILSDPTSLDGQFDSPNDEDLEQDWGLSEQQLSQLKAMTREIFPPFVPHSSTIPEGPLTLAPRIESPSMDFVVSDLDAHYQEVQTREHWREQWEGVLTRYADEVWGGLLPLVREARKEIEEMVTPTSEAQSPIALRRLNTILKHLQQR